MINWKTKFMSKVFIYATKISTNDDVCNYSYMFPYMTTNKVKRIKSYINNVDKVRSLKAEWLLRTVLSEHLDISFSKIEFSEDKNGKPFLYNNSGFNFNVSHSGEWVVCAISNNIIGIDIEEIYNIDVNSISKYFSEEEIKQLKLFEGEKQLNFFFDLWTLKESFLKASGMGLSLKLNTFSVIPENNIAILKYYNDKIYYFKQYNLDPGYKLSVCSSSYNFSDTVIVK